MTLVLDGSMALSWCFKDERTPTRMAVLDEVRARGALVPGIWHLEVANVLGLAVRRARMTLAIRDGELEKLARLPIRVDGKTPERAWTTTLSLADRYSLTAYDAAYLELAERVGFPLASLDNDLIRAAGRHGVQTFGSA